MVLNLYIADTLNRLIRKMLNGTITTVAGGGSGCSGKTDSIGDGCIAISVELDNTEGVAVDGAGSLYIAAGGRIRKVSGTTAPVSFPAIAIGSASSLAERSAGHQQFTYHLQFRRQRAAVAGRSAGVYGRH